MNEKANRWLVVVASFVALAGCGLESGYENLTADPERSLPAETCLEAETVLEELKSRALITQTAPNEATIDQNAWLAAGERGREQLGLALAVSAACETGTATRDQEVIVRGETGAPLMRRTYDLHTPALLR